VWISFLVEDFSAGNYFYPSVLAPSAPFLTGEKWLREFGLQPCLWKNSVVAFGLVLYVWISKEKKEKRNLSSWVNFCLPFNGAGMGLLMHLSFCS